MKKHILLLSSIILLFAFSPNCTKAQITITQADVPTVWLQANMAVDATGKYSPQPASNTSQNWNYAALGNSQTNTYLFVAPASTPYGGAFHSSNLADSLQYGTGDNFFSSTPTYFSGTGYGEAKYGFALSITIRPYFVQIPLPATYGAVDGGVSKGDSTIPINYASFDSGRAKIEIHYADTIDAFGTMTTPFGTQNVLRQKHYDITVDTLWGHIAHGGWIMYRSVTQVTYMYRWYTKGVGYYFATMQMDHTNTKDSLVQWLTGVNLGVGNISNSHYTSVYPNPCQTQTTFNCSSPSARQLSVFDITGREISTQQMNNGVLTVNTSAYPAGIYFYRIADASGAALDRGKFIVNK